MSFRVGDRVRLLTREKSDLLPGALGRVGMLQNGGHAVGVFWDGLTTGHGLTDMAELEKKRHDGWWVYARSLKLVKDSVFDKLEASIAGAREVLSA